MENDNKSKYTPIQSNASCTKEQMIQALNDNKGLVFRALKATGLSSNTFYRWKETDPEFAKDVAETENREKEFVRSQLADLLEKGDRAAIMFYAKCKLGFSETKKIEATVNTTDTIDINATLQSIKDEINSEK